MNARRTATSSAAVVALAWSVALAGRRTVSPSEERVFRILNDRSDGCAPLFWALMQTGSLAAVFVAGTAAQRGVGRQRATPVVVGGVALWMGVKAAKLPVGRGRPRQCLSRVRVRGAEPSGLGYPSGHAAVATMLALLTTPPGLRRGSALTIAGFTGVARMYVGAHLPLDVVGGCAIGTLAAGFIDAVTRAAD